MTRDRYLEMMEQLGEDPKESEIPPDFDDLPDTMVVAITIFNTLNDRLVADIGYLGKDYTNLPHLMQVYGVEDKEFLLETLSWLDSRAIKKSSEAMKRERDKLKRSSSGKRS